jgi:diguanylate cyclase (GGDEF)-like protein
MYKLLKLHRVKLLMLLAAANAGLLLSLAVGDIKAFASLVWMDIVGEGGATFLTLAWIVMVLKSRPAGRVTNLLMLGLGCVFFSWWIDLLDEFIKIPDSILWDHWLESGPMPVGLVLLTLGIFHWHSEQLAITAQMVKREKLFREHRLFDNITALGSGEYLKRQIVMGLEQAQETQQPLSLVVLDIDDFNAINRRHGFAEGDRLLQSLTQLLLLSLRTNDLLCRLAGDRFVALLPATGEAQAKVFAEALAQTVNHFAYHTVQGERVPLRVSAASVMATGDLPDALLHRLNLALAKVKQPPYAISA